MEKSLWPRLNYLKERLLEIHDTRNHIASLDKNSSKLQETVNHIESIYPNSNKNA